MRPAEALPTVLAGLPPFLSRLISFSEADTCVMHLLHNDALIITIHIGSYRVSKILISSGSSINILYGSTLDMMDGTSKIA